MRIAWLGPVGDGGGVPTMGTLLLDRVLRQGVTVELFSSAKKADLPGDLPKFPNLHVVTSENPWQWGRWYSRKPFLAFLSGTLSRVRNYNRMAAMLLERHRAEPFDCIFQFSWIELFNLGRHLQELPPLVVYPCVHAAGELRWHRMESAYARKSEGTLMHYVVRLVLTYRAWGQRRQFLKPAMMLGMSKRFNELAAADYGRDPATMKVLYHPIYTGGQPAPRKPSETENRPLRILYVSRLSVRKGLEQVVELSKRLDDLHGKIQIDVIGGRTQWSDYTAHLKDLNPRIAKYIGQVGHADMPAVYDGSDILLLPSMYEPGGLVVGEALSRGMCVVASNEVGSAEPVSKECCRIFPAGDVDACEKELRQLIGELAAGGGTLRARAASEAEFHFDPDKIAHELLVYLREAAAGERVQAAQLEPQLDVAVGT